MSMLNIRSKNAKTKRQNNRKNINTVTKSNKMSPITGRQTIFVNGEDTLFPNRCGASYTSDTRNNCCSALSSSLNKQANASKAQM